jgi:hypothetical protein
MTLIKFMNICPTTGGFTSYVFLAFRATVQLPLALAAARSGTFVMIISILLLKIQLYTISLMERRTSDVRNSFQNFQNLVKLYQRLNIVMVDMEIFTTPVALAIMSGGLGMEIVSVFLVIRLQALFRISLPSYSCFVFFSFVIPIIAHMALPDAVQVFEGTDRIIRMWNLECCGIRENRGYCLRKIRSLRPCSLYAGGWNVRLYPIRRSTKMTYYSLMIDYVTNALISVPESYVQI